MCVLPKYNIRAVLDAWDPSLLGTEIKEQHDLSMIRYL